MLRTGCLLFRQREDGEKGRVGVQGPMTHESWRSRSLDAEEGGGHDAEEGGGRDAEGGRQMSPRGVQCVRGSECRAGRGETVRSAGRGEGGRKVPRHRRTRR